MSTRTGILAIALACLGLCGCGFDHVATGPERTDNIHLDSTGIERANVELDMGAGELDLHGGASQLIDGTFTYNVDAWKPLINDSTNGNHATVTIKQPEDGRGGGHNTKYNWDLNFNDHVLTDLAINFGVGQAKMHLGSLLLRSLTVHMGVGQVQLDLQGTPTHDYDLKIEGGVGQADIHLPTGVGIYATAHGGIGAINISGLEKKGDHWENDLYDKSKVTVKVEVNGGIGEIHMSA